MVIDLFADKNAPYKTDEDTIKLAREICSEIAATENIFNFVTEPFEIEAAVYKIKSLEASYSALIKRSKLNKIYAPNSLKGIKL